jgi:hypothetical protein
MTTNQRTKTMTTFRLQQFNRGQCTRQMVGASALQISVTKCAVKLHGHVHETRKIVRNKLQGAVQVHVTELLLYAKQALPLVRTRILRFTRGHANAMSAANNWAHIRASHHANQVASAGASFTASLAANSAASLILRCL